MSLFEYAQEVVSKKLERKKPMLSVSMERMQPVMPMAQGGGLSTVQNSLNINGQPHRLAYINPSEENLLTQLGGSGRKIDGIPSYDSSVDGSDAPEGDQGLGIGTGPSDMGGYSNAQSVAISQGLEDAMANNPATFGADPLGVIGDIEAFANDPSQSSSMGLGANQNLQASLNIPSTKGVLGRAGMAYLGLTDKGFTLEPDLTYSQNLGIGLPGIGSAIAAALGFDPSIATITGPTTSPGGNQGNNENGDTDDGIGGDDGIYADNGMIREQIAAASNRKPEEVTVAEVQEVRETLTNKQRVANTGIKEILDQIYGSGKGAGLLGIPTNNTGTA